MKEVILASGSKRRSRILSECGIMHKVIPSKIKEEMYKDKDISCVVQINARQKAEEVASGSKEAIIIASDTLVAHEGEALGKPEDTDKAKKMLKRFSGQNLEVHTGLCVIDTASGKKTSGFEKSSLFVAPVKDAEFDRFFSLLSPYDKAGGFSIEGVGSLLFDNIKGSYFNILGLPMMKLSELFKEINLNILDYIQ